MSTKRALPIALMIVVFAAMGSGPASAGMNYTAGLYLWATGLDGSARVRGQDVDFDLSFTDIAKELEMAAMVHFEGSGDEPGWASCTGAAPGKTP